MTRLPGGPFELRRVALGEEGAAPFPGGLQRAPEELLLELLAHGRRQLRDPIVRPVKLVEARRPHREEGPPRQDLHLHPHLEHVGGGGHRHVGRRGGREELAHLVGRACFERRLVDRADDDVRRPHRERGRDRRRGRDPPRGADPHARLVAVLARDLVTQRRESRQEQHQRTVVRMPPRVRLGGHVVGHRDGARDVRLLGRDRACRDELREEALRRRLEEAGGDLDARDLGHHPVRDHDPARIVAVDAGDAVLDDREREVEVGRRADESKPLRQEEVDEVHLEPRVVRRVNEVHPPGSGRIGEVCLQAPDGLGHATDRQPGRAEHPEVPCTGDGDDERFGRDTVGHLARDVGGRDAVIGAKRRVSQVARGERGDVGEQRERVAARRDPEVDATAMTDGRPSVVLHHHHGALEARKGRLKRLAGGIGSDPWAVRIAHPGAR